MSDKIIIKGARVHNLKNISLEIPKNKLVVITGLSGSGKSSLAFDTIYAEAQRRYMESLSSYARQFLELQERPDVDEITGLTPAIALDQRGISENPRSTLATVTEIADYLRLLFARIGHPFCHCCKKEFRKLSAEEIIKEIFSLLKKQSIKIFAPLIIKETQTKKELAATLLKAGFEEINFNGSALAVTELANQEWPADLKKIEVKVAQFYPDDLKNEVEYVRQNILTALDLGDGAVIIELLPAKARRIFSKLLTCPECGLAIPPLEPRNFSFNSPHGACPACDGLGIKQIFDPELIISNPKLTLAQGAIKPWARVTANQSWHFRVLSAVARAHQFSLDEPFAILPKKSQQVILYGTGEEEYLIDSQKVKFTGVIPELQKKYRETDSDYLRQELENYMRFETCPDCQGRRLNRDALSVWVAGKNIADIFALSIDKAIPFFDELENNARKSSSSIILSPDEQKILKPVSKEILTRLKHLQEAGLAYLTLDRGSASLSGGESERIRLAIQLSTILSGVLYILDEPTVGLHERDTEKLIDVLKKIRDTDNSVLVVEHDSQMMKAADWIIDVGPGAGRQGGEIIAEGTYSQLIKNRASLTGQYLSGKAKIEIAKKKTRPSKKAIEIKNATANNLKNLDVRIPLGQFVCVTGVSGSGKSTLILDILAKALSRKLYHAKDLPAEHKTIKGLEAIDKVITIDQGPIGRTPRSNPATYTGIFTTIRDLFTDVPEAKAKGYDAGTFSFNVRGGRCEACAGEGYTRIPMQFLPETFLECSECHGKRYRQSALEIFYHGKNIADILEMSATEALEFFTDVPLLQEKLTVLKEVGLGYIKLGQPATTLSGGEAQRVKLATELGRRATGKTLYILDEPTTGLHFEDIKNLLTVLHHLVEKGNSMIIIEHNLSVIKTADWVIDLGPEGGDQGGEIVAEGKPKDITKVKKSYTGQYLKKVL